MRKHNKLLVTVALFAVCGVAQAASFTAGGYTQSFDSMATGTTLPTDWTVWSITTGADSHSQWTTSIPGSDVGGGTSETITSALLDSAITNSTKNARPYNIAHAATSTDRVLATSPTGNDGIAIQLSLTNNTGATVNGFNISYDIDKFYDGDQQSSIDSSLPIGEELPGYQLFYSVNGGAWTNVAALNPVRTADGIHPVIPVGTVNGNGVNGPVDYTVTSISNAFVNLSTAWGAGQTLLLRWVDDNAVNISADQIIGLNNVNIAAVPEPETYALMMAGLGLIGFAARRRRG